jgi:hypothetical protein
MTQLPEPSTKQVHRLMTYLSYQPIEYAAREILDLRATVAALEQKLAAVASLVQPEPMVPAGWDKAQELTPVMQVDPVAWAKWAKEHGGTPVNWADNLKGFARTAMQDEVAMRPILQQMTYLGNKQVHLQGPRGWIVDRVTFLHDWESMTLEEVRKLYSERCGAELLPHDAHALHAYFSSRTPMGSEVEFRKTITDRAEEIKREPL